MRNNYNFFDSTDQDSPANPNQFDEVDAAFVDFIQTIYPGWDLVVLSQPSPVEGVNAIMSANPVPPEGLEGIGKSAFVTQLLSSAPLEAAPVPSDLGSQVPSSAALEVPGEVFEMDVEGEESEEEEQSYWITKF